MPYRYGGPARNFVYKDKVYHKGDTVPVNKDEAVALARGSGRHRFIGIDTDNVDNLPPGPSVIDQFPKPDQLQHATLDPKGSEAQEKANEEAADAGPTPAPNVTGSTAVTP